MAEALSAGRRTVHRIYVSAGRTTNRIEPILSLAGSRGIPVATAAPERLLTMAGNEGHQGICAAVSLYPEADLGQILNQTLKAGEEKGHFLLVLDGIEDPQNLGALLRTALCAGVDGALIPRDRAASPVPSVSKASAGAMEHLLVATVTNIARTLEELKAEGIWIAGLAREGETSLFDADFTGSLALVIGGEEKGIRPLVRKGCDFLLNIPQQGPLGSLNASAAGAVALYEAFRQRSRKG